MKNLSIMQFIVIDSGIDINDLYISGGGYREEAELYSYTNSGNHIYPLGVFLPVIKRGHGCIGMGIVRTIVMTENSTQVEFEYTKTVNPQHAQAYYSLYRGQVSMGNSSSGDIYESSEDMLIPGAMATMGIKPNLTPKKKNKKKSSSNNVTHSEINSKLYPEDYDDEEDYW